MGDSFITVSSGFRLAAADILLRINIKTGDGLRMKSGVGTEGPPQKELPYWGEAETLEKQLWQ